MRTRWQHDDLWPGSEGRRVKPYYQDDSVTIYHGDARDVLAGLTADALITDPPFNVGKDYGESTDDLPGTAYRALIREVIATGPEVQAWVTPTKRLSLFHTMLPDALPVVVRRGAQGPKRWGWYDQFDLILVRGKPNEWTSNLWENIRLKGEGFYFREETYGHPGYTPEPIMRRLVALLSAPSETIIDPFAGTGTSLYAAKSLGRRAIGIELDERWCDVAARRCAQEVLPVEQCPGEDGVAA